MHDSATTMLMRCKVAGIKTAANRIPTVGGWSVGGWGGRSYAHAQC